MHLEFDFIVVGGGSSGCVVASRLSENPNYSVLLVEAGGTDSSPLIQCPMGLAAVIPTGLFQWGYRTVTQPQLNNRRGYQPRGKLLGGSSSINAMLYVRGAASDYDYWAELGNEGWDYNSLLPFFKKAEHNHFFENKYHGNDGPLHVENQSAPSILNKLFLKACDSVGITRNDDYNGAVLDGAHMLQRTSYKGERCSAAKAYITPNVDRPNLTVITKAKTQKILVDNGEAIGIECKIKGQVHAIRARREVILCAGAFGSPQILMLSGIGPKSHLTKHGIALILDSPGVGQNLQDHIDYVLSYRASLPKLTHGFSLRGGWEFVKAAYEWLRYRTGRATTSFAESGAFFKSEPEVSEADLQLIFVIAILERHGKRPIWGNGFSCHATVLRPYSRGSVKLASSDIDDAPIIDPSFLDDERDLHTLIAAVKKMLEIFSHDQFAGLNAKPCQQLTSDEDIIENIRQRADTQYHPVGTCKMGPDSDLMSVVDQRLRLKGIKGLRVADASIMPTIISGNTNAPCIMIGERAAQMILEDN